MYHSFVSTYHHFLSTEDEVDDIIDRMKNLDVFDVDQTCWKMLTGGIVGAREKRQLSTLHKNIETDTGMKIISGTALASYKDGTGSPLSGTYIFRYTMELIKNVYDSAHGNGQNDILSALMKQTACADVLQPILDVINEYYKPGELLSSFAQFECWKRVVTLNADTIQSLSKQDNRMLTLEECQHIGVTVPSSLMEISSNDRVVRAVNAFSVRVLNTPYKKSLDEYNDSSLSSVSFIHVAGSSERSQKPFSNKSVAMSLTDELERAVRYAVYYAQVIPVMVFVQINKENAIPTTTVLEFGEQNSNKKYASGQAYNIAEKHHEYIPSTVSYIDPSIIVDMRPLIMSSGPSFEVGLDMGPDYPREHWLQHTSVYVNKKHQRESRTISPGTSPAQSPRPIPAQSPGQSVLENPIPQLLPTSSNRIKKGDRIMYAWNREAGEYYAGEVISISVRRHDVKIKWDDNTSDTLYATNFTPEKYGVTWWYEADITHSPHENKRRSRRVRKPVNYAEHSEKSGYQPGEEIFVNGRKAIVKKRRGKTVTFEYEDTHAISTLKIQ
tara:strand:+ start:5114 stop:6775 length:1662 start_codon:yes stop_codon:yes gene_type:complete